MVAVRAQQIDCLKAKIPTGQLTQQILTST